MLYDAVDAISELLKDATVQIDDDKHDVNEIIPSIDSEICQSHRYYYCKACNQSVRASPKAFNEHFHGTNHLKKLRAVEQTIGTSSRQSKKQVLLNQQFKSSTQSLTSSVNFQKKERLNSLPASVSQPKKSSDVLPKQMVEFLSATDLDNFSASLIAEGSKLFLSQMYKRVCDLIERRLSNRYPKVKAMPFGSVVIGLGRIGGDLDIFIDIGGSFVRKPSKRQMKDAIHRTQRILENNMGHNQWKDFEAVTKARTPILRTFCCSEKIDCDLSFSNGLSCCNTSLIGYYINLQPVCKKLASIIKFWFGNLDLGINSYIVSLMVIFYLQQEKVLPSVKRLQDSSPPVYIDGWNTGFTPMTYDQLKIPLVTSFTKYLVGFFHFYGHCFNYDKHVISILTGTPIEKSLFDHGKENDLPPEFERFKSYMVMGSGNSNYYESNKVYSQESIDVEEADEVEDLFANYKPFVIQDPFELCHNVAKGIQTPRLNRIINCMRRSYEIVSKR